MGSRVGYGGRWKGEGWEGRPKLGGGGDACCGRCGQEAKLAGIARTRSYHQDEMGMV